MIISYSCIQKVCFDVYISKAILIVPWIFIIECSDGFIKPAQERLPLGEEVPAFGWGKPDFGFVFRLSSHNGTYAPEGLQQTGFQGAESGLERGTLMKELGDIYAYNFVLYMTVYNSVFCNVLLS